jgi:Uma2 family endonuclease
MRAGQTMPPLRVGSPSWPVAELFPAQGCWTAEDYLALPSNRRIELSRGCLEFLPMPTDPHQLMLMLLAEWLRAFVRPRKLGRVRVAALPMRLWGDEYREPDILFMLTEHLARCGTKEWKGADLVMEIVSPDRESQRRDYRLKRRDYARARIPEYWIVDPQKHLVTVLRLRTKAYVTHGKFGTGQRATSVLLKGFSVDVDELFSGDGD